MPIYEFKCEHCGHQDDIMQKVSDESLRTCPVCHHNSFKKLVSAPFFHLKGTGWYKTDFKEKEKPITGGSIERRDSNAPPDVKKANAKSEGSTDSSSQSSSTGTKNKESTAKVTDTKKANPKSKEKS